MAAIPSNSDQNSIVVRVPVPSPVGNAPRATAVTPTANTNPPTPRRQPPTFILPDADEPAPRPVKLARLADTRPFKEPHEKLRDAAWNSSDGSYNDADRNYLGNFEHDVLADFLGDHGDPREEIVRKRRSESPAWNRMYTHYDKTRTIPRLGSGKFIQLPDETYLGFHKFTKPGHEPKWIVGWSGPAKQWIHTVMQHKQFKDWLRRFDPDELSRIVKGMRNGR